MATASEHRAEKEETGHRGPAPWLEWLLVAAILLLAGALRMAAPGLSEFKADEARLLALAYDTGEGDIALRGISNSAGLPNFPASVWLYALPVAIWPHPYAAVLFTGLLSTLAVALTYWFVRRYWGMPAALAATLLYAVAPWAIIFSRKIWAQDLLPLFIVGWAIGGALALVERRPRFIWLHLICLALTVQIHLAAISLVPATLLLIIIFRKAVNWRELLIGGLLAALSAVPFAIYLSQQSGAAGLLAGVAGATDTGSFSLASLGHTLTITLGTAIHSLAGGSAFEQYLALLPDLTWVHLTWGLLITAGAILLAWAAWKRRAEPQAQAGVIVLLWLVMPAAVFLYQWTPVYLHYLIPVLPAPFIAAGVAFGRLLALLRSSPPTGSAGWRRLLVTGAWLILLLTAAAQAGAWITLQRFVAGNATPGGYGVPLAMKLAAVSQVETMMAETGAQEVIIAGEGERPLTDEFAAEWDVLLRDFPRRFVDVTQSALFPAEPAIVLLDGRLDPAQTTADLYQRMAAGEEDIALRPGEGIYAVLALPAEARPKQEVPLNPPLLLANWVNFLGYDLPQVIGDSAVWQLHWRTGDNPDPAQYQFFNHLLDATGTRLSQVDGPAFDPGQWRAGDTVISRFLLPWPPAAAEPLLMRVGMYRYPSLENVPLLDEAANPFSDAAEFELPSRN